MPVKIILNKFLLLFLLFSFITLSVFSEHTCHEHCYGCSNLNKTAVFKKTASAYEDADDHICIACLWAGIVVSTGGFNKILLSYENPGQHFIKITESYQFQKHFFDFQMRAPPLV